MPNIFKNEEQRKKWNEYNNAYAKKKYRSVALKFDREKDKDIIEIYDSAVESGNGCEEIKRLLRLAISVEKTKEE